jgi:hypothetical protein
MKEILCKIFGHKYQHHYMRETGNLVWWCTRCQFKETDEINNL